MELGLWVAGRGMGVLVEPGVGHGMLQQEAGHVTLDALRCLEVETVLGILAWALKTHCPGFVVVGVPLTLVGCGRPVPLLPHRPPF